jgi:hypothetical protein
MSAGWSGGSTRTWRTLRARVLARDHAAGFGCRAHEERWCQLAGAGEHTCTRIATHAHHTQGKARGDDPALIVAACRSCNLAIGDPAAAADPACKPVTRW